MRQQTIEMFAYLLHESCRASVAAGTTLAHATDPSKVRPFQDWQDLPPEVRSGRRMTSEAFLVKYEIGRVGIDLDPARPVYADEVAVAIHEAERGAVDAGLVAVKLDRPWVPFADLPEAAKAGRIRQAKFLTERFALVPRQAALFA